MNVPEFQKWMLERDSVIQAATDDGSDDEIKNTQQGKPSKGSVKQSKASDSAIR